MTRWVDVSDIHLRDIRFQVTRSDGRLFDFSDVVQEFSWIDHVNTAGVEVNVVCQGSVTDILKIGGEGSSCRITAPLVDLDTGLLVRRSLWQGTFEEIVDYRTHGQMNRHIIGYDIAKFLATNEADYVFKNLTLSSVIERIAEDWQIPLGTVTKTTEPLGQIIIRGLTLWEAVSEAVQRHADRTGEVFRAYAKGGRLQLTKQGDQTRWWVFETGESVREVRRVRTLADMVNQVKVYGVFEGEADKPSVVAVQSEAASVSLYGLRQRVEYLSSADDAARVQNVAQKTLDRFSVPDETLEITGWLVPNLRAGEQIRYIDQEWGLNRLYYVESIDAAWGTRRAETVALVRREPVDPGLILEEVTAV